jgi:hypothetical protein
VTRAELLEQARKLPREEQLKLARDLLAGSGGPHDDPAGFEAAWATEIGRRLQGIADGSAEGIPDSEVRRRYGL